MITLFHNLFWVIIIINTSSALKILNSLKIKNFILPLYGKSKITDNNYLMFNKKLNSLAKIASSMRINLLIESNISPNTFKNFLLIKKNFYLYLTQVIELI